MRRQCAVLGSPIAHSLSPVLHQAAYAWLGLDWSYTAIEVREEGLAGFLDGLDPSWRGLSLTMPLKRTAMPLVDELDQWARASGAVNTVLLDDGRRRGANTDVPGALAAIRERYPAPVHAAEIWGGGATATSVGLALAEAGCRMLRLVVREPSRATETTTALGAAVPDLAVEVLRFDDVLAGAVGTAPDLLVSTVPAEAQSPALLDVRFADGVGPQAVFEVVYHPWPTPLARTAAAAELPLVSGLDLLVHQAALQVGLMTGQAGPVSVMREAGLAALDARG